MADYPLTNTASDIDDALQKVVAIKSAAIQGNTDAITSGGVYSSIQSLNHTNMDNGFLVTEAEGIASNDTDTQIPTCAAVNDLVAGVSTTTLTKSSEFCVTSETYTDVPGVSINGSDITADGDDTYTIRAGLYLYDGSAEIKAAAFGNGARLKIEAGSGTFSLLSTMPTTQTNVYETRESSRSTVYFATDSSLTVQIRDEPDQGTREACVRNISLSFLKIK